ncbi:hypothetical protein P3T35_006555 [Kitasatospora sp. GP30]|nr:hypothetical protein [Kitasatospora sp. GP30]
MTWSLSPLRPLWPLSPLWPLALWLLSDSRSSPGPVRRIK